MRDPMTDRPIAEAEVREKFGVGPDKVIDVQALCGDSTDNVPGVPGIGVKTAAELINTYGDLETLLARAHEIKQPKRREALIENEAKARLSKELVKLDDDVPLPCPLSALRVKPYDPEKLYPFLDEMELRALKSRIVRRLDIIRHHCPSGPSEPVIPEVPPFTAPRTYALSTRSKASTTGSRPPIRRGWSRSGPREAQLPAPGRRSPGSRSHWRRARRLCPARASHGRCGLDLAEPGRRATAGPRDRQAAAAARRSRASSRSATTSRAQRICCRAMASSWRRMTARC